MRLEDLTVGSSVKGLVNNESVQVVAVKWYGSSVLELTFKNSQGMLASQLLYREDEARLEVLDNSLPWSFDADGDTVRLASEAYRINLAHLFDPYLAVHTSSIEPLPHQISAVYQEMLSRLPLRYILADDPGAGKTIMTGLLLKELMVRGDLKRCLIVSPGSLSEQWQDELYSKFHLKFEILTNDRFESAVSGNIFAETNLCIARLDKLSRNDVLTGILNRRGFNALAESVIKDNRELGRDTIISYVDMNNLKVINDRFGHDDGDFALKAVSTLLTEIIGNRGVVGRIGGDEYAFVYYGDKDEKQLKEEVRRRFAEFNKSTDVPYNVTVSCGFYRIAKDDTERTLDDAMGMADQDLYIAKQMKDNRVLKAL